MKAPVIIMLKYYDTLYYWRSIIFPAKLLNDDSMYTSTYYISLIKREEIINQRVSARAGRTRKINNGTYSRRNISWRIISHKQYYQNDEIIISISENNHLSEISIYNFTLRQHDKCENPSYLNEENQKVSIEKRRRKTILWYYLAIIWVMTLTVNSIEVVEIYINNQNLK